MRNQVNKDPLIEIKHIKNIANNCDILGKQNDVIEFRNFFVFLLDCFI